MFDTIEKELASWLSPKERATNLTEHSGDHTPNVRSFLQLQGNFPK